MKKSDRYYLYLTWPRYLAQWYAYKMYSLARFEQDVLPEYVYNCDVDARDLEPVQTRRGSAERNILEVCLSKQPDKIPDKIDRDATICIEIPNFVSKPAYTYNYLSSASRHLLETTVRNHFRMSLIKYMNKVCVPAKLAGAGQSATYEMMIQTFMDNNGIEYTEQNLLAIKKIWQRLNWVQKKKNNK